MAEHEPDVSLEEAERLARSLERVCEALPKEDRRTLASFLNRAAESAQFPSGSISRRVLLTSAAAAAVVASVPMPVLAVEPQDDDEKHAEAAEDAKRVIRQFSDLVINGRNPSAINRLVSPRIVDHNPMPGARPGLAGVRQVFDNLRVAIPNLACQVFELIAQGDPPPRNFLVAERFVATGTHRGVFHGIRPTNKQVTIRGIAIFRVLDGKIVERWAQFDDLGLMRQLGAIR